MYITGLIGPCISLITRNQPRRAAGFSIDKDELAYPVEEITVTGNRKYMLCDIEIVGSDLAFLGSVGAPNLDIRRVSKAGRSPALTVYGVACGRAPTRIQAGGWRPPACAIHQLRTLLIAFRRYSQLRLDLVADL